MDSLAPKFFLAISVVSLFGPEKSISELHTGTTLSNQLGAVGTTQKKHSDCANDYPSTWRGFFFR